MKQVFVREAVPTLTAGERAAEWIDVSELLNAAGVTVTGSKVECPECDGEGGKGVYCENCNCTGYVTVTGTLLSELSAENARLQNQIQVLKALWSNGDLAYTVDALRQELSASSTAKLQTLTQLADAMRVLDEERQARRDVVEANDKLRAEIARLTVANQSMSDTKDEIASDNVQMVREVDRLTALATRLAIELGEAQRGAHEWRSIVGQIAAMANEALS